MNLEIKKYPDPVLRRKCQKVKVFDDQLKNLCLEMFETMETNKGLGLAAPQIGENLDFFIIDFNGKKLIFINPEIITKQGEEVFEEGCLSFPGLFIKIKRPKKIGLKFQSINGQNQYLEIDGLLARVIQHEYDHLEGILFIDHVSWYKRFSLKKKLNKKRV